MPISEVSPFRQLTRAYSALLNSNHAATNLPAAMMGAESTLLEIRDEIARVGTVAVLGDIKAAIERLQPPPIPEPVEKPARPVDIYERLGLTFLLDDSSLVDKTVIESGTWEPKQLAYVAELTERFKKFDHPMFLDTGSYWGLYSLPAMKSGVFEKQYAFEADRHNFAQLQSNIFLNKAGGKIRTINNAASEKQAVLKFRDSTMHPEGNRAGASVIGWEEDFEGYAVDAVPIDDVVDSVGAHLLMKLDVEGHEAPVLRGMTQTVARNKVVMQVEVFEQHHDQVFAQVERLGLRTIHQIYPDYYLTNMSVDELGV